MAKSKKADDMNEGNVAVSDADTGASSAPEKVEEITFIWDTPVKSRLIVLQPAKTLYTAAGPVRDDLNPPIHVKAINGMFKTSDPDIIARLKAHPNFEKGEKSKRFSVMKKIDHKASLKAAIKSAGITKEELNEIVEG